MRIVALTTLVLVSSSFLIASPARATCEVTSVEPYPDVNYVTVCALDQGSFTDGTQTYAHEYLVHVMHAFRADPGLGTGTGFTTLWLFAEQDHWTYDDGSVQQDRTSTDIGSGTFDGSQGVAGGGYQADITQRDQNAIEPEGSGACSSFVGRSTCAGASGWFTVQGVASLGAGLYDTQEGSGSDCHESYELDLDAGGVLFIPVTTPPGACTAELPSLYDNVPFSQFPMQP